MRHNPAALLGLLRRSDVRSLRHSYTIFPVHLDKNIPIK